LRVQTPCDGQDDSLGFLESPQGHSVPEAALHRPCFAWISESSGNLAANALKGLKFCIAQFANRTFGLLFNDLRSVT
jgi:hypothetical protein